MGTRFVLTARDTTIKRTGPARDESFLSVSVHEHCLKSETESGLLPYRQSRKQESTFFSSVVFIFWPEEMFFGGGWG